MTTTTSTPPPRATDQDVVDRLRTAARETFGYAELRPGQLEAMTAVMAGRDTLAVMPTGSGKSAIYQVPAVLLDGPTVVVSPLIALQRDQVTGLLEHEDAGGAVTANSTDRRSDREAAFADVRDGDVEFLFLAPEQLTKPEVLERVAAASPSLFVVDEAHCVSAWGHDFRPDYLRLGAVIESLGHPRVLALTATASPPVREEIVSRLGMREPELVVRGFDRPNLALSVDTYQDDDDKRESVVLRVAGEPKPGLVYTGTRASAEAYAEAIAELGLRAAPYHAGLKVRERDATQAAFMAGELDVVVATTAFGMGIDKADVRFVVHADIADSMDSYYQEIGRAGRDGEPALAHLFYRPADLGLRTFFASGTPKPSALRKVAALVEYAGVPVTASELAEEADLSKGRVTSIVNLLEQAGAVEIDADGGIVDTDPEVGPAEAAGQAMEIAESRKRVEQSRVEMMRGYAETQGCRRQYLLAYFGEVLPEPCGNCDTCGAGTAESQPDVADSPFPISSTVRHRAWGEGTVMRYESDRIVVLFGDVGYKTLSLDAVRERGLLEASA